MLILLVLILTALALTGFITVQTAALTFLIYLAFGVAIILLVIIAIVFLAIFDSRRTRL